MEQPPQVSVEVEQRARGAALVIGIVSVAAAAYAVPFWGPMASLLLIALTHGARRLLWPSASEARSAIVSVVAWVGLWLPGLLDLFTPLLHEAGVSSSTTWLTLPLCGPERLADHFLPAAAATGVCLLGLLVAALTRRPWPWVVAAWLAPWAHLAAFSSTSNAIVC